MRYVTTVALWACVALCWLVVPGWRAGVVTFVTLAGVAAVALLRPARGIHADRAGLPFTSLEPGPAQSMQLDQDEEYQQAHPDGLTDVELDWVERTGELPPAWWRDAHAGWDEPRREAVGLDEGAHLSGPATDGALPPFVVNGYTNAGAGVESPLPAPAPVPDAPGAGDVSSPPTTPAPGGPPDRWMAVGYRDRTARAVRQSYAHGPLLARLIEGA